MAGSLQGFATLDDFLAWERQQDERYEYLDGAVTPRAGGSLDHATIAGNIETYLRERLRGGACRPFGSDAKVILAGRAIYPDVSVTCAPEIDGKSDLVPDPVVVIEVVSPSTARRDKSRKKLRAFQTPSVQHFVTVEQDEA
jgi:Uma2 family endonuclease